MAFSQGQIRGEKKIPISKAISLFLEAQPLPAPLRTVFSPLRLAGIDASEPRRGVVVKISWRGANTAYAPVREVLIEVTGKSKNIIHIRNAADIPAADILIEGWGGIKHIAHIRNAADIPATDILIEGTGAVKHLAHIRNHADIPAADILIEGTGLFKHVAHIRNHADIPAADILIEGSLIPKQGAHIANAAGAASSGVGRNNLAGRPFGIFSTTYCAALAKLVPGTENGYAIAMERKSHFAYSIH